MANTETKKETMVPVIKTAASKVEKINPNFNIFSKLAPSITGIARKNVNSVATNLDAPNKIPPTIVAPEREVPGIKAST